MSNPSQSITHHYKRGWSEEVSLGKTGTEKVLLKKASKCLNSKLKFNFNCTVTPQPGELWVSQLPCPTSVNPGEGQLTQVKSR